MLEKDNSPRSIRVRITGFATLFFLLGFFISLILTIATGQKNEGGDVIYSKAGISFNFIFALGLVISFILFITFLIIRFIKQSKGPALKMTPKQDFKDDYDLGQHIADIKTSKIGYLSFFQASFHTYQKDIITLLSLSFASLGLGLYLVLSKVQEQLGYTMLGLFILTFLISMILLFALPFFEELKQDNILQKSFSLYQDKIYFELNSIPQEYTFAMCHKSYTNQNGVIFIFYRDGEKRFFFQKKDVDEKTFAFLQLKAQQVNNNN